MNLYVENLAGLIAIKEANFVPVQPIYTVPVQILFLFRTGKIPAVPASYRPCRPRAGEIRLFRPVNRYRVKIEKSQRKILTNFKNLTQNCCRAGATPPPTPPTTTDNPNPPIPTLKNPTHTTHEQKSGRRLSLLCISPNKTH